ncbi:MAG: hypothetical protein ACOX02_04585 [Acholeplasmatales bacterium]
MLIGLISNNLLGENDLSVNYKQITYKHDIEDLMTFDALIVNMEHVLIHLERTYSGTFWISQQFTENLKMFSDQKRPVMIVMPPNNSKSFKMEFISHVNFDVIGYLNFIYPNVVIKKKKYTQFNEEQFDVKSIFGNITYYIFENLLCLGSARKTNEIVYGFSSEYNVLFVPFVNDYETVFKLFSYFNQKKPIEQTPSWMEKIFIFNEKEILGEIEINNKKISKLKNKVTEFEKDLSYYSELKSIIYTSGEYLQEIVTRILRDEFKFDIIVNNITNADDIVIKCDNRYLVIEVKGVKGSINSKHVMQASKWKNEFMLKKVDEEPNIYTRVKALLIVNPMKDTPIDARVDEFPADTIRIATSNDVSMISTKTLLKLLEDFKLKKLSKEHFFNVLYNEKALIEYNQFSIESEV